METIGQRVRALREAAGMTRDDLAAAVRAPSKTSIQNLEEAPNLRASRYLRPIAEHFRVNQSWLETGRGEKAIAPVRNETHDFRQSYPERPDAAKMAAAYGAVVANGFLLGASISAARADHMEVVCDAYVLISQGKQILPGQSDASGVIEAIQKRLGITGGSHDVQGQRHGTSRK